MSNFIFFCPFCRQKLDCEKELENQVVACASCNKEIILVRNKFEGNEAPIGTALKKQKICDELAIMLPSMNNQKTLKEQEAKLAESATVKNLEFEQKKQNELLEKSCPLCGQMIKIKITNSVASLYKKSNTLYLSQDIVDDGAFICPHCATKILSYKKIDSDGYNFITESELKKTDWHSLAGCICMVIWCCIILWAIVWLFCSCALPRTPAITEEPKPFTKEWLDEEHARGNFRGYDDPDKLRRYIQDLQQFRNSNKRTP